MKNDLTTGAWQHDLGCPINIVLFSISDVHIPLSNVECLVLLHSPIIIDFEKLGTINKEVNNDKMDNDFTTQEIDHYFFSSVFVSGCIFKKE
jgi:hypothetical protein